TKACQGVLDEGGDDARPAQLAHDMPTKPLEAALDRDFSRVAAKELIEIASPLLQEIVNFGTNALQRCHISATGGEDEDIAALLLYRQIIEFTDGIEVLVSQACVVPAIPLLRASFEASLALELS